MYVDESGCLKLNDDDRYYVISGVIIHEHDIQGIEQEIEKYKLTNFGKCDIEIHSYHIWNGRGEFKDFHPDNRKLWMRNLYKTINYFPVTLIGIIIDKFKMNTANFIDWNLLETAWTFIIERFDMFLHDHNQKGMIRIDKSMQKQDNKIRYTITRLQKHGSNFHIVQHIFEQPLFINSMESTGIQIADSISYCLYKQIRGSPYEDFYENYVFSKYRCDIITKQVMGYGLKIFPS